MRIRTPWLLLMVGALVLTQSCARQEAVGTASDETAIRNVIAATTEMFNRRDAAGFVTYYTPDADLMTVRGEVMKGTEEIRAGLQRIFDTRAKNISLREIEVTIRFIKPDVALAHVTNELSGLVGPDGAPLPPHRERSIRVFLKTPDGWKVTAFQNTRLSGT